MNIAKLLQAFRAIGNTVKTLGEAAIACVIAGIPVFPIVPGDKKPLLSKARGGKGFHDASLDIDLITTWWSRYPNANLGAVPGQFGLVVIDVDGPRGEQTLQELGLSSIDTLTASTGRPEGGRHLYFLNPGIPLPNSTIGPGTDTRGHNGYVVLPPSFNKKSGRRYQWVNLVEPLPLPDVLMNKLVGKIPEGDRNNTLFRELCLLRYQGADEPGLAVAARELNTRCTSPVSDRELAGLIKSAMRYPPGNAEYQQRIAELNTKYAVVRVKDKGRILDCTDPELVLMPPGEFKFLLGNQYVTQGKKRISIADLWLQSSERRQYDRLVFEPGLVETPGAYNLWHSWGVTPRPGDCSLFFQHILWNVCRCNEALYIWVIAWFAHIFQYPRDKPGTAIVLRGRQGTGKTIVGEIIGHLLGASYTPVASARYVTGQFNTHLERTLLLHADEAFWAGDLKSEGVLKNLITSTVHFIERKGIDPIPVSNYVRLLATSNADWCVPAGLEERRFCVTDVGEGNMQDKAFFGDLMHQMKNGGYEALLDYLLHFDCTQVDLRTIPETGALFEQKIETLNPIQAWWLDILDKGILPGDAEGYGQTPKHVLFDSYIKHAQAVGRRRRSSETALGIFLNKHVPGLVSHKMEYRQRTVPAYEFPSLTDCRAAFAKLARHPGTWGEDCDDWQPDPWAPSDANEPSPDAFE